MVAGVKVGRAAHPLVRDQAKKLAITYRQVLNAPNGEFCVNPSDEPEEQQWINVAQALDHVLAALERFDETGDFGVQLDLRKFGIREFYKAAIASGSKRNDAIEAIMDRYSMSRSVAERTTRSKGNMIDRDV